ncbi:MAG TPA: cyclic pyranopterin monophosphate synthase MoaC [Myxococcota bacterium]|nr:cyclic pyranopterin monophosphate synthase MoaC [Myxococcota bacterium]
METTTQFSHLKADAPAMVDISEKTNTRREAIAVSHIRIPIWLTEQLQNDAAINQKGPVFHTAIIAGTMAAKSTSALIPLCHAIGIDYVHIDIDIDEPGIIAIRCRVKSLGRTGVEMEALTGASVAALTIYDMCKSLSFDMEITGTRLMKKTGGKSDVELP